MHTPRLVVAFAGLALGSLTAVSHAQPAAKRPAAAGVSAEPVVDSTVARFLKIRTPGSPTIAPDGTLFVRDWPQGIWQLFRVDGKEARPDSKTVALTSFPDGLSGYSLSPDGGRMLLTAATGGNENTQVYALDPKSPAGTAPTPLLQNPKVQFGPARWLADGSGFLYTANDASPNDFHIYRYDFKGGDPGAPGVSTKLLAKAGTWRPTDITRDGSRLLVSEYRSSSDSSMFEVDAKTGALTDLTALPAGEGAGGTTTASTDPVGYTPDERGVLFVSDMEGGSNRLFLRDLATRAVTQPVSELARFEVDGASVNTDRTLLGVVTNEDGYGVLHVFRLPGFDRVALPPIEKGVVSLVNLNNGRVVWNLSNARTPGLAFAYEIPEDPAAPAGKARQLTFAETQGLDLSTFGLPELVKYEAFDGTEIPAFIYLPPGAKKGTPVPFVVNYHGGPEGQSRPGFDRTIQFLLAEGFGVMQPNIRGSSGYGRAFLMMDDYKKRWDSVRDGVDAAEWLVAQGYATPGKIAAYGGSYGGFMAVATLIEDQERVEAGARAERVFGASVNVVGIVNMRTFLEQTSGYRRKLREVEYGPLTDPAFLETVSSIKRADKIMVPMMIAHGLNDPRVPVGEAMQLAVALQARGMDPELFFAPDEGHGFAKLSNRLIFSDQMVRFLKRTVGEEKALETGR